MPVKAWQLFAEMQQQGLETNLITYIAVSSACGKGRCRRGGLAALDEMPQQGLKPN